MKKMKISKKQLIRIILNILIVIAYIVVVMFMLFTAEDGVLMAKGTRSLRYFTTLSNILEAIASLLWVIAFLTRKNKGVPVFFEWLKYIATVEVFVTFFTIVVLFMPVLGFEQTCSGTNFWMHIVFPLAAILEQIFLADVRISLVPNLLAVIPPLLYGTVYVLNIVINGIGAFGLEGNDWYGFLLRGPVVGGLIFFAICLLSFLLGLLLRGLWKAVHRKKPETITQE